MKNRNSSIEVTSDSMIPDDLLTPTLGSNYGLDGYPDLEYNAGVLSGILDQKFQDVPALPTGVSKGAAEDMDLTVMVEESLADLDWLDPSQLQDPSRLPKNPVDLSIPELTEAWGVNRRTDGVSIYASHQADLNRARYESSLENESSSHRKASSKTIEKVVTHAMRRSIEGHHIDRIVKEAAESMGEEMGRVVPLLKVVESEHHLAGNVYIRASAYPGWGTGKWKEHAKRFASKAKYIIVSDSELKTATWIQDGRCSYTGKTAVTQVPWKEAFVYYAPRLKAAGYKVASGSHMESLRLAFSSTPERRVADGGFLPTHQTPDQTITMEAAVSEFSEYTPESRVYDPAPQRLAKQLARVKGHLAKMEDNGILPIGGASQILNSGKDPISMLKMAASAAARVKESNYSGDNRTVMANAEFVASQVQRKQERVEGASGRISSERSAREAETVNSLVSSIKREIDRGARGEYLRKFIAKNVPPQYAAAVTKAITPVLKKTGALEESRTTRTYEQTQFTRAATTTHKSASVPVGQIARVANWIRRSMSEGFAGKKLDELVHNRFTSSMLVAAGEEIRKIRAEHEGASGFLYVDASAYASESGYTGCEQGALKHRANRIPSVIAMPRCATCTLATKLEDGSTKCGIYNKTLIPALGAEEASPIKERNIKACNMDDTETTVSLFAPAYNPSEFGLSNDSLEGIDTHMPEQEKVNEIFFGDWDL